MAAFMLNFLVEIDALFLDDQRTVHDTGIDTHDVLAYDSDEEQLDSVEEEHADEQWSLTRIKAIPIEKLIYKVA